MKRIIVIIALIALGVYLPIAFMDAMVLQSHLDAQQARMDRVAKLGR